MIAFPLFVISGVCVGILLISKRIEEKRHRTVSVLRAISTGEERLHELRVRLLNFYAETKERFTFVVKKQLPIRARSYFYKTLAYLEEKLEDHIGDIRNSRLIKRSDGISEYFKNISEIERGVGEIHDSISVEVKLKPKRKYTRRKVSVVEVE